MLYLGDVVLAFNTTIELFLTRIFSSVNKYLSLSPFIWSVKTNNILTTSNSDAEKLPYAFVTSRLYYYNSLLLELYYVIIL